MSTHVPARLLRSAVHRAGDPGGVLFTERQLYYEVCRMLLPVPRSLHRPGFTVPAPIAYDEFRDALDGFGPVPELLSLRAALPRRAGRNTVEPDLFDYGLPRLLVCESDGVAQMLRANGIPMESACPVYGAGELPLDPRIVDMLALAEGTVYVLHDASPRGLTLPARVQALTDLPESVRVVPLGLRPRQARALHLTHRPACAPDLRPGSPAPHIDSGPVAPLSSVAAIRSLPDVAREFPFEGVDDTEESWGGFDPLSALDPGERTWLRRGRYVEVEAVRPASLLRTVHRLVREVRPRPATVPLRRLRTTGFLTWPTA